jgi:hypothetical protein
VDGQVRDLAGTTAYLADFPARKRVYAPDIRLARAGFAELRFVSIQKQGLAAAESPAPTGAGAD